MKSQELRQAWIDFFVSKQHKYLPSASLIPDEMSTTLFTIAGMEQFVPVFLGEEPPAAPRVVTVQRCLRVAGAKSDIENVGRTGRHGTFLEMLGNFSFGDYYKREAIAWAWEFVTKILALDPSRLYVTVHTGDDEAEQIWTKEIGLRKALGATNSSILMQFFLEGLMLTGLSGVIGILGAAGLMIALRAMMGNNQMGFDPPTLVPWSAAMALGSLTLCGIVAGLYPASKAAQLDPIEALRRE